jgi:hypothetical protein
MAAILADIAVYGLPFVVGLGVWKILQGRYYGRKKSKPNDNTQPNKDE